PLKQVSSCTFHLFFHAPAPTAIYTLSLHDALPILHRELEKLRRVELCHRDRMNPAHERGQEKGTGGVRDRRRMQEDVTGLQPREDRKSTRLNSSHRTISYAVFCLKKKKKQRQLTLV